MAAVVLAAASSASATFPGGRGPIAFQRITDEESFRAQVFSVGPGGGRPTKLTSFRGGAFAPDYSPDGQSLAVAGARRHQGHEVIYTMRADGSQQARLGTACSGNCLGNDAPAWSPDAGQLAFLRLFRPLVNHGPSEVGLLVGSADGSSERELQRFHIPGRAGREAHDPQWSPDGTRLAFALVNVGARPKPASAIYLLDVASAQFERLTPFRLNAGNPDWSPDGTRLVFNSSNESQAQAELYTINPDGSGLRRLRDEPRGSDAFDPVWSPDGSRVAFVRMSRRTVPHIWTMRANGTRLRRLTRGPLADFRPDWGGTTSLSGTGLASAKGS